MEDKAGQEVLSPDLELQEELLDLVKENLAKAQDKSRGKTKLTGKTTVFKVGDKVWRQNIRSQQRKFGKLDANFLGPYTIVAIQGKNADLKHENGAIFPKINVDPLKKHIDSTPTVPHWDDKKKMVAPSSSSPSSPLSPQPAAPPSSTSQQPAAPPSTTSPQPAAPPQPTASPSTTSPQPAAPSQPTASPSTTSPQPAAPSQPTAAPSTSPQPAAPSQPTASPPTSPQPAAPPQSAVPTATARPSASPSLYIYIYTRAVAEKYVRDAWAGKDVHILLSKIGAYKIFYWDIHRIGPDMELESELINPYMAVMGRDYNRQNATKAAFIDSFAMSSLWKRKTPRLKIKPMEFDIIVRIINEHHNWTLADKKSLFLDPLGESKQDIQTCLEITRSFMRRKGCNVSRWTCGTVPQPKQQDASSCGVFALKFAEQVLESGTVNFLATKQRISGHRLKIAINLLLQTDDLKDTCHFCGEEEHDTDQNWIQCDSCGSTICV